MKINIAWLEQIIDLQVDHDQLLRRINRQLGEIETINDWRLKYQGAMIVKV